MLRDPINKIRPDRYLNSLDSLYLASSPNVKELEYKSLEKRLFIDKINSFP